MGCSLGLLFCLGRHNHRVASLLRCKAGACGESCQVWRHRYFASQGFYVVADYQTLNGGPADNVADKETFVARWAALVTKILRDAPEAQGKLLLDLINEPDRCGGEVSGVETGLMCRAS